MRFCYWEAEIGSFSCSDNKILRVRFVECFFYSSCDSSQYYAHKVISSAVDSGKLYLDVLESKFHCYGCSCLYGEVNNGGTMYISIVNSEVSGTNSFRTNFGSRNEIHATITHCNFSTTPQGLYTGSLYFGLTTNSKNDKLGVIVADSTFIAAVSQELYLP